MSSYSELLQKHGFKTAIAIFLGILLLVAMIIPVYFILVILGTIVVLGLASAGAFDSLKHLHVSQHLTNATTPQQVLDVLMPFLQNPAFMLTVLFFFLLIFFLVCLLQGFQSAGKFAVANEAVTEDQVQIGTFFSKGFSLLGKMATITLLTSLPFLGIFVVMGLSLPLFTLGVWGVTAGWVVIALGILAIIYLMLLFMHAPVILVSEQTSAVRAISLSVQLARQSFGKVFVSGLLAFVINAAYTILLNLLFGVIGMAMGLSADMSFGIPTMDQTAPLPTDANIGTLLLLQMMQSLFELVVIPFMMAMITLLITHRYHKHLRQYVNPEAIGTETVEHVNREEI